MHDKRRGFTLIELMIAMAISGIVLAGIYTTYQAQQESYIVQEQASAMQQNIRAAMYHLERDIRMAGYDPENNSGAGFVSSLPFHGAEGATTDANNIAFTVDDDESGSIDDDNDELRAYRLNNNTIQVFRTGAVPWWGVAENIDVLNFVYLDRDGAVTAVRADIRAVQINIVARAARFERGYVNNKQYFNQNPNGAQLILPAQGDNFRRKRLSVHIDCRNMGM